MSKKKQGLQQRGGKRRSITYYVIFCVEAFRTKWLSKGLSKIKDK